MSGHGADIRVVSAEAVRDILETVAGPFAIDTGNTVSFAFMTAGQVRKHVDADEPIDLAIASSGITSELVKAGKVSSSTDLARIGLAVAVHESAPLLDLSTPDALVKTLLAARAVSYTHPSVGGTAGLYFGGLLRNLGIADDVNKRTVFSSGGRDVAEKVARGDAELGITFPSEINPVKGAKVGGMFPHALQNYVVYAATVPVAAQNADVARTYVALLTDASATPLWERAGFEALMGRP